VSDAAFCLAQVYVSLDDYQSARQTLENMEANTVNKSNNSNTRNVQDTFLFSKLSHIAELQNDIAAAIRYQEKVCNALTNNSRERNETFDRLAEMQRLAVLRNPHTVVTLQTNNVQLNTEQTTSSERRQTQSHLKPQTLNEKFTVLFDNNDVGSSVGYIDAIPLSSPREERLRDWFFVNLLYERYIRRGVKPDNVQLAERVGLAIDRLKNLYAKDDDLFALSAVMKFYSRDDDAATVDKKLLSTATDLRVITSIVDSLGNISSQIDDEQIRSLLRVLRLPTVSNPVDDGGVARRLQERIVLLLERNGKLDSLINGLEKQLSSAPQSIAIMNQLLDVYVRSKRMDDAKRVLTKMSAAIGGNTKQMIMFSNRLSQLDMNDEAVTWQLRVYERSPAAFFDNFWQNQNEFRKTKRVDELVDAIKKFPPKVLLDNIDIVSTMVSNNLADFDYRTQFVALAEALWNDNRFNSYEQKAVRQRLVRAGLFSSSKEFYPFVHQYVFDMLRNEGSNDSPHKVQIWAVDKARSFSLTLLDMMTDEKKLQQEITTLITEFGKIPLEQRNWQHYVDAKVLEILLLLNKNETDKVIEKLEQLRKEQKAEMPLKTCAAILGQELSYIDNPKAKTTATEYLTTALETCQRENTQGHAIDFLRARLTAVNKNRER
jgi:pentatricopeptide repeat protein